MSHFRGLLKRQLGREPLLLLPMRSLFVQQHARAFAANVSHIQNTPHLKRKLGQHLLVSEKILTQIVDAAQIPALLDDKQQQQSDGANTVLRILEIGPGTGNLTSALLNASPSVQVHAIEYDTRMVERLNERFKDMQHRLTIEQKDFEEFEFASHQLLPTDDSGAVRDDDEDDDSEGDDNGGGSLTAKRKRASGRAARRAARLTKKSLEKEDKKEKSGGEDAAKRVHFDACVANIPYQLSSIIISRLSNYMHKFPTHFKCAVLLVQEEFALRLLAKPGDQNYSRLSVNTALVADVTSVVNVGRGHFLPPPKVDSRVIKLVPITDRIVPGGGGASGDNDKLFFQKFDTMLRICFLRKNKTLRALLLSKTSRSHIELTRALRAELENAQGQAASSSEDNDSDSDDNGDDDDDGDSDEEGDDQPHHREAAVVSEKDLVTEQIEAALNECQLSSTRAVQIHVDQFLRSIFNRSQTIQQGAQRGEQSKFLRKEDAAQLINLPRQAQSTTHKKRPTQATSMSQDPYKPSKEVEMGVPVDYQYAQQHNQHNQHNQQYAQGQYPPPPYDAAVGVPVAAPGPQHVQVDQYGRPIVTAVPMHVTTQVVANNANIRRDAQGNALCNKCSAPYPLPAGATSWRCRNCHELNNASVYGDECCIIL